MAKPNSLMGYRFKEYMKVIKTIILAMNQLIPDGRNCTICGDNDHQAFECHMNPIVLIDKAKKADTQYRCYHCKEVFDDEEDAKQHFGYSASVRPKCVQKKCLCGDCPADPLECQGVG